MRQMNEKTYLLFSMLSAIASIAGEAFGAA